MGGCGSSYARPTQPGATVAPRPTQSDARFSVEPVSAPISKSPAPDHLPASETPVKVAPAAPLQLTLVQTWRKRMTQEIDEKLPLVAPALDM